MWKAATLIAALAFSPAIASAQQPCTPNAQRVVDAIYRQVLERGADRGSAGFVERLSNGSTSVRELVREIAKSPEHIQRFLSSSNREEAATYLYRHILGRQPDSEGLRGHAQGLAAKGPSPVIDAFVNSAEYDQKFGNDTVPGTQVRYCVFGDDEGGPVSSYYRRQMRFQGMDRNNDGIITRNEWRGSRESFVVNDWNGDGVLSGEEVRVGGRRDDDDNVDSVSANRWTEAGFSNLDRNRDGRVTQNEWPYDIASFRAADTNRNGVLTMAEFTRAGADTGYSGRATERERFNNMDANRDGRLTFDEWNASARAFDLLDTDQDGEITRAEFFGSYR